MPALILFLHGIEHFSSEIQNVAGKNFKNLLSRLTSTRWSGFFLGTTVTALIQSSSATTVILVGLVDAGIISFMHSLPVVFGAAVGTTITAQLVAFKLTAYAPLFIVLGFLLRSLHGKYSFLGPPLFYFGLVFFSLNLISNALDPIKTDPHVQQLFAGLSSPLSGILTGVVFTILVQSSSVTSGLLVVLAASGLVTLPQAVPVLFGAAIGTTSTAILASLQLGLHAKRVAVAHLAFKVLGVLCILPFLRPFEAMVAGLGGGVGQQVANALTVFQLFSAGVFLILLRPFAYFVQELIPGTETEILFKPHYLTRPLPKSDKLAFRMIGKEMRHTIGICQEAFEQALRLIEKPHKSELARAEKLEDYIDYLEEEISAAILELSNRGQIGNIAEKSTYLVRLCHEIEQLGDLANDLDISIMKMHQRGQHLDKGAAFGLEETFTVLRASLVLMTKKFPFFAPEDIVELKTNYAHAAKTAHHHYGQHLERMRTYGYDAKFVSLISIFETANDKIRDIRKIAEDYQKISVD